MKRKLPEKFFEQNQRAKTRKWKFFNLNQALWGAGNREFRRIPHLPPARMQLRFVRLCRQSCPILFQLPAQLELAFPIHVALRSRFRKVP